jgi:hypothetical protein
LTSLAPSTTYRLCRGVAKVYGINLLSGEMARNHDIAPVI